MSVECVTWKHKYVIVEHKHETLKQNTKFPVMNSYQKRGNCFFSPFPTVLD